MEKHLIFVIHGISDGSNIDRDFANFSGLIKRRAKKNTGKCLEENFDLVKIDWSKTTQGGKSAVYQECFGTIQKNDRSLIDSVLTPHHLSPSLLGSVFHLPNPLCNISPRWHAWRGWRYFSTLFVGDIIAYTDAADNGIREAVWQQMSQAFLNSGDKIPRFSIVGHSLGSVIAFDFLFALLSEEMPRLFSFDTSSENAKSFGVEKLLEVRNSFCNLFTVGSPIGLFLMRNRKFWQSSANWNREAEIKNLINPLKAGRHKWINILDTDDFVGYPLEAIFSKAVNAKEAALPQDRFIDCSWFPPLSHVYYWQNATIVDLILKTLYNTD